MDKQIHSSLCSGYFSVIYNTNFDKHYLKAMKKKECPSCAMMVDAKSQVCPVCEYEFPGRMGPLQWAAIAIAVLFLVYLVSSVLV